MPSINNSKTILVIGATSGIGRALAVALSELPNKPTVIASGRRQDRLDELKAGKLGGGKIETVQFDQTADNEALKAFVNDVTAKYPTLDTVIFSAGVQYILNFAGTDKTPDIKEIETEVRLNYTSVLILISLFMPHLLKVAANGQQAIVAPVTSGLAFVPGAFVPNYSATKAALHSFCLSLNAQLQDKNVHVVEIAPPLVESELHDAQGTTPALVKMWMPLEEYTKLTVDGLVQGDKLVVASGTSAASHDKYESGKEELVSGFYKKMSMMMKQ